MFRLPSQTVIHVVVEVLVLLIVLIFVSSRISKVSKQYEELNKRIDEQDSMIHTILALLKPSLVKEKKVEKRVEKKEDIDEDIIEELKELENEEKRKQIPLRGPPIFNELIFIPNASLSKKQTHKVDIELKVEDVTDEPDDKVTLDTEESLDSIH
jgi:hypothetical protein